MPNELHTMPLHIERLLSSNRVRMLKTDEFGAYIKLLCAAWLDGAKLSKQVIQYPSWVHSLTDCGSKSIVRITQNVVNVFFEDDGNGNLVNPSQVSIYIRACEKSKKASAKATAAIKSRWEKERYSKNTPSNTPSNTQVEHPNPNPNPNPINTPLPPLEGDGQKPEVVKPQRTPSRKEKHFKAIKNAVIPESINTPDFMKAWESWNKHREETKKWQTEESIKAQLKNCEAWGEIKAIDAIYFSIAGGYQGLFEPKAGSQKQGLVPEREKHYVGDGPNVPF